MKFLAIAVAAPLLIAVGVAIYVRLAPVKITDVSQTAKDAPGDYTMPGGHYVVRPLATVDLAALETQISATPRTTRMSGSADTLPMIFIHRSWFWGFPDVTQVWTDADNVHIHSHLVFGKSDLGVNRKRLEGWLAGLGL